MAIERSLGLRPRQGTTYVGQGATLLVTDLHGAPSEAHHGFWVDETRMLSRYAWKLDGKSPRPAGAATVEHRSWLGYFVAAPSGSSGKASQQTLELRVARTVDTALREQLELTNHTQSPATVRLSLEVDADFADMREAGGERKQTGQTTRRWNVDRDGRAMLAIRYVGEHRYDHQGDRGVARIDRSVTLALECAGCAAAYHDGRIEMEVSLAPHASFSASLTWTPAVECSLPAVGDARASSDASVAGLGVSTGHGHASDESLAPVVIEAVRRAQEDLAALRIVPQDGAREAETMVGGWPTYTAFFGRDSLAASWQAAMTSTERMRAALAVLASSQARGTDAWRDEQPGRMLHEQHTGPLAALCYEPHGRYYGDVTSSIYYPVVVAALWHWTGDRDLVRPYVRPALDALAWADEHALRPDGFYRYRCLSEQGEKNQGWKDSDDAIVYADGTQVADPLGTCEMQAFVYAAKVALSEVLFWLDDVRGARDLFTDARDLRRRFNEVFWMPEERYVAMAIDGDGRIVRSVASDPGHCMAAGILDDDRVPAVAARLMSPELFSGWGVRTLSARHAAYDPFAYHRGTVWPVENAVFAMGFARYGLHREMHALCKAQFEAARLFEGCRLPETFAGHARDGQHPFPGLYPDADWPQAWSASAVIAMLQAMLGVVAYAPLRVLMLDPHLPDWLPTVTLTNLRVGAASVDLRFFRRGERGRTDYEVLSKTGTLHVVRQPSPQSLTAGWAERVRDAVGSLVPGR